GGAESSSYTVQSGDTLIKIAQGLAAAINADKKMQVLGVSATTASNAILTSTQNFTGTALSAPGANAVSVSAVDGGNNTVTNTYGNIGQITTYAGSTSSGATETMALGANAIGNATATIGGSITAFNTLTITAMSPFLFGGSESATYTVLSGDTT